MPELQDYSEGRRDLYDLQVPGAQPPPEATAEAEEERTVAMKAIDRKEVLLEKKADLLVERVVLVDILNAATDEETKLALLRDIHELDARTEMIDEQVGMCDLEVDSPATFRMFQECGRVVDDPLAI